MPQVGARRCDPGLERRFFGELVDPDDELGVDAGAADEVDQVDPRGVIRQVAEDVSGQHAACRAEEGRDERARQRLVALQNRQDEDDGQEGPAPAGGFRLLPRRRHGEDRGYHRHVGEQPDVGLLGQRVRQLAGQGGEGEVLREEPQEAEGDADGADRGPGGGYQRAPSSMPGDVDDHGQRQEEADQPFQNVDRYEEDGLEDLVGSGSDVPGDRQRGRGGVDRQKHDAADGQCRDACREEVARMADPAGLLVDEKSGSAGFRLADRRPSGGVHPRSLTSQCWRASTGR